MSKRGKVSSPDVPETTAESPSGAINIKGNKVKKSDSEKLRELLVRNNEMLNGAINLAVEISNLEQENDILQERVSKLEMIVIEQRGVIGYLEHKMKEKNDDTN